MAVIPFRMSLTYEWYRAVKQNEHCRACGGKPTSPGYLHFHHVDPSTKKHNIGAMVRQDMPKHEIIQEMQKCVIVCHPCHNDIHSGFRKGWLKANGDGTWNARKHMPFYPHTQPMEVV